MAISGSIPAAMPGPWLQLRIAPNRQMSIDLPTKLFHLLLVPTLPTPSPATILLVKDAGIKRIVLEDIDFARTEATPPSPLDCSEAGNSQLQPASCMTGDSTEEACPENVQVDRTAFPPSALLLCRRQR